MKKGRLLSLCAVALLTACHGDSSQTPAPKRILHAPAPAVAKHGANAQELTAGMVEAVSIGNTQVPVKVKFDLAQRPVVGKPLEIAIAVMPEINAGSATVHITGSDGLELASGNGLTEIPSVEAAAVYRQSVELTPTADGVQLMEVSVALKHDEITETRAFSIPLIVTAGADSPGTARR
jgi:hypothetical protein